MASILRLRHRLKSRTARPGYYLVSPWHFKKELLDRERDLIFVGTKTIFLLPEVENFEATYAAARAVRARDEAAALRIGRDMKRSLVLGVNGQDGSYLAKSLLRRGHHVTGIGRGPASHYIAVSTRFQYVPCDLIQAQHLVQLINETDYDFAFHFAAVHGADGFCYETVWRDMMTVNVSTLHALLEHARLKRPHMRVIYAGSCKIFPAPLVGTIDEMTPARASCLYSIGKIAGRDLIAYYRSRHGVIGTNLVLFNHNSPRRPMQYLLPTLARAICDCRSNPHHRITVKRSQFHGRLE